MGAAECFNTVCSTITLSMLIDIEYANLYCYLVNFSLTICLIHFSSAAVDLLRQLKERNEMSTYMVVDQVFI